MSKIKLIDFLSKRVIIVYVVLSVIDIAAINHRWIAFLGLTIGTASGLLGFWTMVSFFSRLMSPIENNVTIKQSIFWFALRQILFIVLLAVAIKLDIWLFAGMTLGILLVPLTIMINSLTEFLGITHNNFE